MSKTMTALIIMDGFGINPAHEGNAIYQAGTPHLDELLKTYPHTQIGASGMDVGLPDGLPGLLGGHAPEVHHRINPFQQAEHGARVLQARGAQLLPGPFAAQVRDVGQAQRGAVGLQARAQLLAQASGGSRQ